MNSYAILLGLAIMVGSEAATIAHIEPFWSWNTPICWTGFILFADSVVRRARGRSWLASCPREFAFLAVMSIPLWLIFEGYNLVIRNWYYTGLPDNPWLRYFGYAWAFATISPALFEGAELIAVLRGSGGDVNGPGGPAKAVPRTWRIGAAVVGAAMLVCPFVVSPATARYLAAPVWLGFIFLVDPINEALGFQSITGDLRRGSVERLVNLLGSGLVCGVLWEFWNYWSRTKWHYTVPIMPDVKIFEMPLPGYCGFPPFAVECFAMYVLVRGLRGRAFGSKAATRELGCARQIGL